MGYWYDEEWAAEESELDVRVEEAEPKIVEILENVKVATDRELKVRLEKEYFPWVVGRGIGLLLDDGVIQKFGYPGRRAIGRTEVGSFYAVDGVDFESVRGVIKEKKSVSEGIANILTGISPAGQHAEDVFEAGFRSLGFTIHGRNVSSFKGRQTRGPAGKEVANVDFVVERDGMTYGVDVKNWIRYEWDTRDDIVGKVRAARELGVVPFLVVRYLDQDVMYNEVIRAGGLAYRYGELLVPSVYESLARAAKEVLGYPVLAVDELPKYKVEWMGRLHSGFVRRSRV